MIKLKAALQLLHENEVRFIVIGGMAAVAHGTSYVTNDLDICYERTDTNFSTIVKALRPYHPRLRGPFMQGVHIPFVFDEKSLKNGMNFTFETDLGEIDLLGEVPGIGDYRYLLPRSQKMKIFEQDCSVLSLEDLIQCKKIAGRKKDLLLLDQLEALQEFKKELLS